MPRRTSPYKPTIGGPASGRPAMHRGRVGPGKKARRSIEGGGAIKPIGMGPATDEARKYLSTVSTTARKRRFPKAGNQGLRDAVSRAASGM